MYRHLTRNSSSDGQSLVMRFEICCAAGVMSWFIAAGGLGRAGTIGARLLIELGMEPTAAVRQVRAARPGAIETREQEKYVLDIGARLP